MSPDVIFLDIPASFFRTTVPDSERGVALFLAYYAMGKIMCCILTNLKVHRSPVESVAFEIILVDRDHIIMI